MHDKNGTVIMFACNCKKTQGKDKKRFFLFLTVHHSFFNSFWLLVKMCWKAFAITFFRGNYSPCIKPSFLNNYSGVRRWVLYISKMHCLVCDTCHHKTSSIKLATFPEITSNNFLLLVPNVCQETFSSYFSVSTSTQREILINPPVFLSSLWVNQPVKRNDMSCDKIIIIIRSCRM